MTDQTPPPVGPAPESPADSMSRRRLFRAAGAGAAVVGGGSLLAACSSGIKGASSSSGPTSSASSPTTGSSASSAPTNKSLTIGWIHPLTGPLSGFGAPDGWVLSQIAQAPPYKNGFKIGGSTYTVNIKSYDSQSSVTRAAKAPDWACG